MPLTKEDLERFTETAKNIGISADEAARKLDELGKLMAAVLSIKADPPTAERPKP